MEKHGNGSALSTPSPPQLPPPSKPQSSEGVVCWRRGAWQILTLCHCSILSSGMAQGSATFSTSFSASRPIKGPPGSVRVQRGMARSFHTAWSPSHPTPPPPSSHLPLYCQLPLLNGPIRVAPKTSENGTENHRENEGERIQQRPKESRVRNWWRSR